ncbi:hypothetical protein ABZ312_11315 [Streptomyces sp. NPDC006207]
MSEQGDPPTKAWAFRQLAALAAGTVAIGWVLVLMLVFAVLVLAVLGVLVYIAWSLSPVVGLLVTLVIGGLVVSFLQDGENKR